MQSDAQKTVSTPPGTCWILTDGRAGNLAPVRGIAAAVGLPVVEKVIDLTRPWVWLPPGFWPRGVLGVTPDCAAELQGPPWPSLILSCGRRSIGPALELKRRSGGAICAVHVQHPRLDPTRFDLVVAPVHDRLSGANVETTLGSVHAVTRPLLDAAAELWRDRLASLPSPRVAVLIGGSNSAYRLDAEVGAQIGTRLADLCAKTGCGLMLTGSRRTDPGAMAALRTALAGCDAEIWSGEGENPYRGYLGLADHVIVTCDSVNMASEAAATGRPISILPLPVTGRVAKFERFHAALAAAGISRPFDGTLADWGYPTPDDTDRVAARIRGMLGL